jgi:hypothetical protein
MHGPQVVLAAVSRSASALCVPWNRTDGECRCAPDITWGRQMGGHTCARTAVLAVQEDPPSPAVRPGPIHGMGRSVRCRAHHLTGSASVALNDADGNRPTSARTFFVRPEQGNESEPARASEHNSMRMMRQSDRKVERTHLKALLETFERPLLGASHLPLFPHFARHLTRDWRAV